MKHILFFSFFIIILISCNQSYKETGSDITGYALDEAQDQRIDQPENAAPEVKKEAEKKETDKKKIIKNGNINITVDDLQETKSRFDSLVRSYSGYYSSESLNNTDYSSIIELQVRIPSVNFEKFIDDIESGEGEITYKNIAARDVTEEYIDIETRLENKRNYVKRYNELLKQARTIKDILEIEEKMRTIEEEIESAEGRLRYLSDQVSYSTLNVYLTKEKDYKFKPEKRKNFFERFKKSISRGWFGFVDFFIFIVNLWPFIIIGAIVWYMIRRIRKKRKSRKK